MENFRIKIKNTWSKGELRWRILSFQWESRLNDNLYPCSNELSFGIEILPNHLCVGLYWKKEVCSDLYRIYILPFIPIRIHRKFSWGGRFT